METMLNYNSDSNTVSICDNRVGLFSLILVMILSSFLNGESQYNVSNYIEPGRKDALGPFTSNDYLYLIDILIPNDSLINYIDEQFPGLELFTGPGSYQRIMSNIQYLDLKKIFSYISQPNLVKVINDKYTLNRSTASSTWSASKGGDDNWDNYCWGSCLNDDCYCLSDNDCTVVGHSTSNADVWGKSAWIFEFPHSSSHDKISNIAISIIGDQCDNLPVWSTTKLTLRTSDYNWVSDTDFSEILSSDHTTNGPYEVPSDLFNVIWPDGNLMIAIESEDNYDVDEVSVVITYNLCSEVNCSPTKCESDIWYTGGECNSNNGNCYYPNSDDCDGYGCTSSGCNPDPCINVTCPETSCNNNLYEYNDFCENGLCDFSDFTECINTCNGDGIGSTWYKKECSGDSCNTQIYVCNATAMCEGSNLLSDEDCSPEQGCIRIEEYCPYGCANNACNDAGRIFGNIKAGSEGGAGVSGINVCATSFDCDETDENGYFDITELQHGTYSLTYTGTGHDNFDPPSGEITITVPDQTDEAIIIIDESLFTISGTALFAGTTCPVEGAIVTIDGPDADYETITNQIGFWESEALIGDNYEICISLYGHEFTSNGCKTEDVDSDMTDVNFSDITTNHLSIFVQKGCNEGLAGVSVSVIADDGGNELQSCYDESFTTDENGYIGIDLSPINYLINYTYNGEISDRAQVSLNDGDNGMEFTIPSPLYLEINGLPEVEGCEDYFIMEQGIEYDIEVLLYEVVEGDTCFKSGYDVCLNDQISNPIFTETNCFQVDEEEMIFHYTILPLKPNTGEPYSLPLSISASKEGYSNEDQYQPEVQLDIIVLGKILQGETFVTALPEIPWMILHDPSGDHSNTYFESSQHYSNQLTLYAEMEADVYTEVGGSFLGMGVQGSLGTSVTVGTEGQMVIDTTFTNNLSTDQGTNPELMGPGNGDIYAGMGINIKYGIADTVSFDINECEPRHGQLFSYTPDSVYTEWYYTDVNILNNQILPCVSLENTECIDKWENILNMNISRDNEISPEEYLIMDSSNVIWEGNNISFSGGAEVLNQVETCVSSSKRLYGSMEIESSIAADLGLASAKVNIALEVGGSTSSGEQHCTTTGVNLYDDDTADQYSITIYEDPVFGTPMPVTFAGNSSCPWEGYNYDVDSLSHRSTMSTLNIVSSINGSTEVGSDVPLDPDGFWYFDWIIQNNSIFNFSENAWNICFDGNVCNSTILFEGNDSQCLENRVINIGEADTITITVDPIYLKCADETIDVSVSSSCDEQITSEQQLKLHYKHVCPIPIVETNTLIVNNPNCVNGCSVEFYVDPSGPLFSVDKAILELEKINDFGLTEWISIDILESSEFPENPPLVLYWDLSHSDSVNIHLEAGTYNFQVKFEGNNIDDCINETPIQIAVDRLPLEQGDEPSPNDGGFYGYQNTSNNQNKLITYDFTEGLACNTVNNTTVEFLYITDSGTLSNVSLDVYSVTCDGNSSTIYIHFEDEVQNRFIDKKEYSVKLTEGIKDINGNPLESVISWSFIADLNPVMWSPFNISGFIDTGSTKIYTNHLYVENYLSSTLLNRGSEDITFEIECLDFINEVYYVENMIPSYSSEAGIVPIGFIPQVFYQPGIYKDTVCVIVDEMPDENLTVTLQVNENRPSWAPDESGNIVMDISGNVNTDDFDIIGAFVEDTCVGCDGCELGNGRINRSSSEYSMELHCNEGDVIKFQKYDTSEDKIKSECSAEVNCEIGDFDIDFSCGIAGCMDNTACNYTPEAEIDDDSCTYSEDNFDCNGNCTVNLDECGICGGDNACLHLEDILIPDHFSISSIYPNPFNPMVSIEYGLPEGSNVELTLFNITGKQISTLHSDFQAPGYHQIYWDGSNHPTGLYFLQMKSESYNEIKKMILLK